jgi:putative two-component system response regulator
MSERVLVVDDDSQIRGLLVCFLAEEGLTALTAGNGLEALEVVARESPDLVILDVEMPRMDGFETCRRLKSDERTALIPVTMLTGLADHDARVRGIEAGADDFLAKPFDPATLRARIRSQLRLKRLTDQLERTEAVILAMARWVESRDPYTEGHLRRVAGYGEDVARALGMGERERLAVRFASILHDIGKISIPDAILSKVGPLTPGEESRVRRHPDEGAEIIAPMRFAPVVAPIIRAHHERWDGRGYPRGSRGEEIPLGARILSVVDAWDAMTTDRPYRAALDGAEAERRLRAGAGEQWDPRVVDAFLSLHAAGELNPLAGIELERRAA